MIEKFVFFLGRILSCIFTYKLYVFLLRFKTKIYSGWISCQFENFDSTSIVIPPFDLKGGKHIRIGKNVRIEKCGILSAWGKYGEDRFSPEIYIGNNVGIGEHSHISAINMIIIRDGVLLGKRVTIVDNSHGRTNFDPPSPTHNQVLPPKPPSKRHLYSAGPVVIGDNVWIGDKVTILPNVQIGENSIIGANSVVSKNIPPNCVAVGIPAKVIKGINTK
jgi:acetyltransferase-like isoleucine patch superfamily enzyme